MALKTINKYVGRQFSNPVGIGGTIAAKTMNIINKEHYRAVKKYVCKNNGARVLDIGFGNGHMIKLLSGYAGVKLYGIDISPDMLEKAQALNADGVSLNRIMLSQASVTDLPYNDGWFDTVYTINTVYFWGEYEKAFAEILRVLKSGGNFICTFYSNEFLDKLPPAKDGFVKFTPQQLRAMARENGFVNVKVKILKEDKAFCLIGEKP